MHTSSAPSLEVDYPYSPDVLDLTLIHHVAQRFVPAMEVLYDRYASRLVGFIHRIIQDRLVAEELMQETLLHVWQRVDTYHATGSVGAWIFRIARNRALDHLRRTKVRPSSDDKDIDTYHQLTDSPLDGTLSAIELQVERTYHHAHLEQALSKLPPNQRYYLELVYFQGMTHHAIALHTQTPLGTVKYHIKTALCRLAHTLQFYPYGRNTGYTHVL
jgi:RNA polymerase sigma-70 factor (ECF subfamily)